MTVKLTKIVNGEPAVTDALANGQTVKCPLCERPFRLGYSDNEYWVKDWLGVAETAIRKDHKSKHQVASIPIEDWKRRLKRRCSCESLIS